MPAAAPSRLVVYTAITEGYDPLRPVAEAEHRDTSFVAFLEQPQLVRPWQVRRLDRAHADPVRDAKRYKILPHRFFPDHEYSLWIDGKMAWAAPEPVTNVLRFAQDADLVLFEHPLRCCLYSEACECIHRRLDDPAVIYRQVQRYTREGFPPNRGLFDAAVLLRRHTPAMRDFCELWWEEIEGGSRRDQLSLTYCLWKCGVTCRVFPGSPGRNPFFWWHRHLRPIGQGSPA